MSLYSQTQADATEAQQILAEISGMESTSNATLAGTDLIVVVDASGQGEELMIGGKLVTLAMTASATCDQAIFDSVTPTIGQAFTHGGKTYKLLSTAKDGIFWRFILGHASQ
jgi:hypothetical protein